MQALQDQRIRAAAAPRHGPENADFVRRMQPCLGTYVEVAARAAHPEEAAHAIGAAFAAVHAAQRRWSFHDPDSELSRLNRSPGLRVEVSPASLRLLRLAQALMRASEGAFDVTVGGLLVADGHLPDHGGTRALERGTAADLEIGRGWARLARPVRITLDGIAKGYAVDLAIGALRHAGADAGWVNAGGDLRAFGEVTVPIQLRDRHGRLTTAGGLRNMAIATSHVASDDDDEPAATPGRIVGLRGLPAAGGLWSVLARSAWRADALTKVAACTPAAQRAGTVARLGGRCVEIEAPS